jgi:hypothetical protein
MSVTRQFPFFFKALVTGLWMREQVSAAFCVARVSGRSAFFFQERPDRGASLAPRSRDPGSRTERGVRSVEAVPLQTPARYACLAAFGFPLCLLGFSLFLFRRSK